LGVVVYQNGLAFVDAIKMLAANLLTLIWWGKRLAASLLNLHAWLMLAQRLTLPALRPSPCEGGGWEGVWFCL
jgi:hypothetical protein